MSTSDVVNEEMVDERIKDESFIMFRFSSIMSVDTAVKSQNVSPLQLLAVGEWMIYEGRRQLDLVNKAKEEREAEMRLSVPQKPGIIIPNK